MNKRLLAYLRKLGLDTNATDEQAWEFFRARKGLEASIANCLNHNETDTAARTNCDLMLRALGHNPENPSEVLIPTATVATPARTQPGSDGASADGVIEAARAEGARREATRRSEIQQMATMGGASAELTRTLIEDPMITIDVARTRLWEDHQARTRANVPQDWPNGGGAPAGHVRNSVSGNTADVLCAGMLQRSGIDPTQGWVGDENGIPVRRRPRGTDLEQLADQSRQFRAMSMEDFVRAAAAIDGVRLPHGRLGLLEAYIRASRSGFSTSALTAIFTTNMNSQLLASFDVTPDFSTAGFCRESDVGNFQTQERSRMLNGGALDKLPRGSEANHAEYEDSVETFKIARYAKQFVVDDQDIIDDTFGGMNAFAPADMGVAARQLRPDLVASILIGNPVMRDGVTLFHDATHGNWETSAPLGTAGKLELVRKKMRILREGVRNLNLMVKYLIVPAALEDTADVLVKSRVMITGSDIVRGANNPNEGKGLVVVADSRFDNGVTDPTDPTGATVHAGSATTWWASATASAHTIEVAHLRGTGRVPQVRSKILDQGRWGIGWDIKHDIGAKALAWQGLQRVAG